MLDTDVLIIGAGPAGCATALGLLAAGCKRVVMVDRALASPMAAGESATPDVPAMLGSLGLERDLGGYGHAPYHGTMSLWGGDEPVFDDFLVRGRGHGWHLQRAQFDDWLREEAQQRGATLLRPARAGKCEAMATGWSVGVSGCGGMATEVRARVVVDAGGRRAPWATCMGARRRELDSLVALALYGGPAPGLAGLSLVESFADGWWYAAALPGNRSVVMLMTDRDEAKDYRDPGQYLEAWRATRRLAELVPPQDNMQIHAFAAHSVFLEQAAGPGWIAVGDALLAMDPLTSSGIAGALSDAQAAIPAIVAQLDDDMAPSRAYAERANWSLVNYVEGLRQQYGRERRWADRPFWARRQTRSEV